MVEGEKLQKQPAYRVAKKREDIVPPETKVVAFKHPEKIGAEITKIGDELNPDIQRPPEEMIRIAVKEPEMVKAARTEGATGSVIQGKTETGSGTRQIYVSPETLSALLEKIKPTTPTSEEGLTQIRQALGKGEKPEATATFNRTVDELKETLEK